MSGWDCFGIRLSTAGKLPGPGSWLLADIEQKALFQIGRCLAVAAFIRRLQQDLPHILLQSPQRDPVLRTFGTRYARLDFLQIEFEDGAVFHAAVFRRAEHLLRLVVVSNRVHIIFRSARIPQVGTRLFIHREQSKRRAILRRHIADRRSIRDRQPCNARPEEFDKFPDDLGFAQQVR